LIVHALLYFCDQMFFKLIIEDIDNLSNTVY